MVQSFREEKAPSENQAMMKNKKLQQINIKTDLQRPAKKSKLLGRFNAEKIWRRTLIETFREYMENCSLSGFKHLIDPHKTRLERWIWLLAVLTAVSSLTYVVAVLREESLATPILVSLDSTRYHISNVAFPAVSICNINRISRRMAKTYADFLFNDNTTYKWDELYRMVRMLGRLHDYDVDGYEEIATFQEFLNTVDGPFNVNDRMLQLSPSCEDILERCSWRGHLKNCSVIFTTVITQNGYCCTFNYNDKVAEALGDEELDHDDQILTTPLPGFYYGLSAILNPQLDDYAYPLRRSEGFDVLIYDPYDYPDQSGGGLVHRLVAPNTECFLNMRPTTVTATPDVKRFSIKLRGCRFADEVSSSFRGHYSYSNCIVRCRIRALVRLCKCVPFFLPAKQAIPRCTLENIPCLHKYRQKMMFLFPPFEMEGLEVEREDSLLCPECFPDCTPTRFTVTSYQTEQLLDRPFTNFGVLGGLNTTGRCILHLFYTDAESDLYKMDVLFYWFEILSNLGGLGGLFIGFSLISVSEFFYFSTIRFYFILKKNYRKYGVASHQRSLSSDLTLQIEKQIPSVLR